MSEDHIKAIMIKCLVIMLRNAKKSRNGYDPRRRKKWSLTKAL